MIRPNQNLPIPVDLLPPEGEGVVIDVSGDEPNVHRLEELGIRCGCRIRMLCPGETCLLAIEGKRMCLRLGSVAEILVSPVA